MELKRINDINTLATSVDNETYIIGTDEFGDELTIVFNTIDTIRNNNRINGLDSII